LRGAFVHGREKAEAEKAGFYSHPLRQHQNEAGLKERAMEFAQSAMREIGTIANELGVEPATLMAVVEVESGGRFFATVDGREEPLIRFEGHYFDRRLSPDKREAARAAGLASPVAGAVANPASQEARWRLMEAAAAIDRKAAYESTSWGAGQVMGAHWAWLGYADVEALAAEARSGAAGQLRLMARYLDKAGLAQALRAKDWAAFARGYNGPAYAERGYDRLIAQAYGRHSGTPVAEAAPNAGRTGGLLRRGSRGEAVRELQRRLSGLGHPLQADGIFGPATERAVRAFQAGHGLAVDGIVGPQTAQLLEAAAKTGGLWPRLLRWLAQLLGTE
jgi:murein L,D-transpeptidase YcbB/YkuD